MTGSGPTVRKTEADFRRNTRVNEKQIFGMLRENFSGISTASAAVAGLGGGGQAVGQNPEFLKKGGDTMVGPLALGNNAEDISVEIQSDNSIDIGPQTTEYTSSIYLNPTDSSTLQWINNAQFDGQLLFLKGTETAIISNYSINGGNILIDGQETIEFALPSEMLLKFDAFLSVSYDSTTITGVWRVITVSGGSGGGGDVPDGTEQYDHLEWDNDSEEWVAQINLDFPNDTEGIRFRDFIDSGFLTFGSNQVNQFVMERGDLGVTSLLISSDSLSTPEGLTLRQDNTGIGTGSITTSGLSLRFQSESGFLFRSTASTEVLSFATATGWDFQEYDVRDVDRLKLIAGTQGATSSSDYNIYVGSLGSDDPLIINTPSTETFGVTHANNISLLDSSQIFQKRASLPPFFDIFKDSTATTGTIAKITFSALDDLGQTQVYAAIQGDVEEFDVGSGSLSFRAISINNEEIYMILNEDNDSKITVEKDITMDDGSFIDAHDTVDNTGYFVDAYGGALGDEGSNQIPWTTDPFNVGVTVQDLDDYFGSAIGCEGLFSAGTSITSRATKVSSTSWMVVTYTQATTLVSFVTS